MSDAMARLRALRARDPAPPAEHDLTTVHGWGRRDVEEAATEAMAMYAGSWDLDLATTPSLLRLRGELVGFVCDLVDAPAGAVGSVTSGIAESTLLAVQAARDARPLERHPTMVLPETAHPAFLQAARCVGVTPILTPVDEHGRAQVGPMARAMDRRTVLAVVSAPSTPLGVVDPVAWIAPAATALDVPVHVDASLGGLTLPLAEQLGRSIPSWTFAVRGVTSISTAVPPAGSVGGLSLLLFRTPEDRRASYAAAGHWPGRSASGWTTSGTAAAVAGAWATIRSLGVEGCLDLAAEAFAAVDEVVAGVARIPGIEQAVRPDATVLALRTDGSCDVFTVADELAARGWRVHTHPSRRDRPPSLNLAVSAATAPHVDDLLTALDDSARAARDRGPARVPVDAAEVVAGLDPAALDATSVEKALVAAGLLGHVDTDEPTGPPGTAALCALLDGVPSPVRDALLASYVEHLGRPVRAGTATASTPQQVRVRA